MRHNLSCRMLCVQFTHVFISFAILWPALLYIYYNNSSFLKRKKLTQFLLKLFFCSLLFLPRTTQISELRCPLCPFPSQPLSALKSSIYNFAPSTEHTQQDALLVSNKIHHCQQEDPYQLQLMLVLDFSGLYTWYGTKSSHK